MRKILIGLLIAIAVFTNSKFESIAWSEDYVKDGYVVEIYGLITSKRRGLFGQKTIYMTYDQYGSMFGNGGNIRYEAFMQKHIGEYVKVTIENFGKLSHNDTSIFKYGNYDILEWEIITEEEFLNNKLSYEEAENIDSYNIPYDKWITGKEKSKQEDEKDKQVEELKKEIDELRKIIKNK